MEEIKSSFVKRKKHYSNNNYQLLDKIKKNKAILNKPFLSKLNIINREPEEAKSENNTPMAYFDLNGMSSIVLDLSNNYNEQQYLEQLKAELLNDDKEIENLLKEIEANEAETKELEEDLKTKDNELEKMSQEENELQLKLVELQKINVNLNSSLAENDSILPANFSQPQSNSPDNEPKDHASLLRKFEKQFCSHKLNDETILHLLENDLLDYQIYINELMSSKKSHLQQISTNLQKVFTQINSGLKINLTGSFYTHTELPWSNIDYILYDENNKFIFDDFFIKKLRHILLAKPWIGDFSFVEEEIILKTNDLYYSFKISVHLNKDVEMDRKRNELIQKYFDKYDMLLPITIALKTIIKNANICQLGTYPIILLIIFFIQRKHYLLTNNTNYKLANFFREFFIYYSLHFDLNSIAVVVKKIEEEDEDTPTSNSYINSNPLNNMVIVDPLKPGINLVEQECKSVHLKMIFLICYMSTQEVCECGCHYGRAARENTEEEAEHGILKKMFNAVRRVCTPT